MDNMTVKLSTNHAKFKQSILYNSLALYKRYATMTFDSHDHSYIMVESKYTQGKEQKVQ